jgi:hypothetical protein
MRGTHRLIVALAATAGVCSCGDWSQEPPGENGGGDLTTVGHDLSVGASGDAVRAVNEYLGRYGYFPNDDLQRAFPAWRAPLAEGAKAMDVYDDRTAAGVRLLQQNNRLPVSGVVDQATKDLLLQARCATPDNIAAADPSDKFDVGPGRWSKNALTWRVTNAPSGLTMTQVRSAISTVLPSWASPTVYSFTEVTSGTADIMLNFGTTWCANGQSLAGSLAAGTGPGTGACITFNTAGITWSVASPVPASAYDLKSVARHELGHTLGMGHSSYSTATMFCCIGQGTTTNFTIDDATAGRAWNGGWNLADSGSVDVDIDDGAMFWTQYVTGFPAMAGGYRVWSLTNGGPWVEIIGQGGIGGVRLSSNPTSNGLWIVQDDGDIYRWNGSVWVSKPGCASDIAVGPDNTVWSLGCNDISGGNRRIYKWNGSAWVQDASPGAFAVRISVGLRQDTGATVPWIVRNDGSMLRRSSNGTSSSGSWQSLPGTGTDIAANASGYTWSTSKTATGGGFTIQAWNEQPSGGGNPPAPANFKWITASGGAVNIATSSGAVPVVVNNSNGLFIAE